jgi:hypothetical protein
VSDVERVEVDGTVVAGVHPFVYAGRCLECGRPEYGPGCTGEGSVPRDNVFTVTPMAE